ncbi:MAG: glycosyltransferase family 2 protein [Pirellulales bacterium]|nr:glycosyltransferase family 2 protein [Pirellulales bacterium]
MPDILPFPRNQPDLDIGVVYTGERDLIEPLLSSLRASHGGLRVRLLLVDNASPDAAENLHRFFPNTLVLRNERRLLYTANLNRVLRASRAKYILLLNTDMLFDPAEQCLERMAAFMNRHPDCGVSGCRLHHPNGRFAYPARRFQTLPIILARRLGLGRWMTRTLDRYLYREHAPEDTFECDWLSGCFLMVRRAAFEDIGSFDEKFTKYFEDVDLCLRMARAGWKVMYHGGVYALHLERRASRNLFSADAHRHLLSYFRWLWKWGFAPDPSPAPVPLRRAA